MRLFGTTFAFQQDLRKCSEGILRLGRQGLRRAMIMRRLANDTEVDIDVTKASTIVQADTDLRTNSILNMRGDVRS